MPLHRLFQKYGLFGRCRRPYAAALTPLAYIPAGILLLIWYRGRLHSLGWGMVIRILLATGLPFLFYFTVGLEGAYMTVLDLSLVLVHFLYVWCIVRVLKF